MKGKERVSKMVKKGRGTKVPKNKRSYNSYDGDYG